MRRLRTGAPAALLALTGAACYDFRIVGPEDPPAVPNPTTVSVTVTYSRPAACLNSGSPCDGNVVFFGSWMRDPNYVILQHTIGHAMTATVANVPVNFPNGEPHTVYVNDPFIRDVGTCGVTAERLVIGREPVRVFQNPGGCREQGLIRIDASGFGRTP